MKLASMNARDRRALTLGALVVLPGLLVPFGVKPYLHALSAVREQTATERDRLVRARQAIAALPTLPAVRTQASRQLDRELARLFQASDDLVATGDLAQYVSTVAQESGLRLQQSETRPAHPVMPGVQALQMEVRAEGDLEGILHFLQQLESGGKLIRLGALSIDGGRGPLAAPANTIVSLFRPHRTEGEGGADMVRFPGVEVLSLAASVYGYRLSGASWSSVDSRGTVGPSPFPRPAYAFESLDAALDHDPFNGARARPSVSYRAAMAGDTQPTAVVKPKPPPPPQQFRLVGTVLGTGHGSFALCQNGDSVSHVVRVGEELAGWTVSAIRRGVVVFTTPQGDQLELHAAHLGSSSSTSVQTAQGGLPQGQAQPPQDDQQKVRQILDGLMGGQRNEQGGGGGFGIDLH